MNPKLHGARLSSAITKVEQKAWVSKWLDRRGMEAFAESIGKPEKKKGGGGVGSMRGVPLRLGARSTEAFDE